MDIKTKREILIKFMQVYAWAVHRKTGIWLFIEEDKKELEQWPEDVINTVYNKIEENTGKSPIFDSDVWPWCIRYPDSCEDCEYAERHGLCCSESKEDNYAKVVDILGLDKYCSITDWFGEDVINMIWESIKILMTM